MTTSSPSRLSIKILAVSVLSSLAAALLVSVTGSPAIALTGYDSAVLSDRPVAYWAATSGTVDLTGRGHAGVALGGTGDTALLPDGEKARTYDGVGQYVSVPSSADFSISTTHSLTWEAWIKPAVLQFPRSTGGYVDFMGKCAGYSPTCEWEARMYNAVNSQNRASRISAYAFNQGAGLGSAADWQPVAGLLAAGGWIHVVGQYQTSTTPSSCSAAYPGTVNIWVDGVKQNFAAHAPTGCMSQYSVIPLAGTSPLNIGTMARDSWFQGAIGKVAIYNGLLSQARIDAHFAAMTGRSPSGSCASSCTLAFQPGPGAATATPSSTPTATPSSSPTAVATATASPTATATPRSAPRPTLTPTRAVASPAASRPTLSPAPAPTATATATATPSSSPTPTALVASSPTPAVTTSARVTSSWSTGYCAVVTVSTTGPDLTSWLTTTTVNGRITSSWGATWTRSSSVVTLGNLNYNGKLTKTAPVTNIGFCAVTS